MGNAVSAEYADGSVSDVTRQMTLNKSTDVVKLIRSDRLVFPAAGSKVYLCCASIKNGVHTGIVLQCNKGTYTLYNENKSDYVTAQFILLHMLKKGLEIGCYKTFQECQNRLKVFEQQNCYYFNQILYGDCKKHPLNVYQSIDSNLKKTFEVGLEKKMTSIKDLKNYTNCILFCVRFIKQLGFGVRSDHVKQVIDDRCNCKNHVVLGFGVFMDYMYGNDIEKASAQIKWKLNSVFEFFKATANSKWE